MNKLRTRVNSACQGYGFLLWAALPLSVLGGLTFWLNSTCVASHAQLLREFVQNSIESDSKEAILRLVAASHISLAINFSLFASSIAVIILSGIVLVRQLNRTQLAAAFLLALIIAAYSALDHYRANSCLKKWVFTPWSDEVVSQIPKSIEVGNLLIIIANVATAILVVAMASLHKRSVDASSPERAVRALAAQFAQLRELLISAAISFTIAIYALFFGLKVSIAAMEKSRQGLPLDISSNITVMYGAAYTIFLLSAFYPTLARLRGKARDLAEHRSPGMGVADFLSQNGLEMAPYADVKDILAVLGPLVASATVSALRNL